MISKTWQITDLDQLCHVFRNIMEHFHNIFTLIQINTRYPFAFAGHLIVFRIQQIFHTVQADCQRGNIMDQRGKGRLYDSADSQQNPS